MNHRVAIVGAQSSFAKVLREHVQERELEVELDLLSDLENLTDGLSLASPDRLAAADLIVHLACPVELPPERPVLTLEGSGFARPWEDLTLGRRLMAGERVSIAYGLEGSVAAVLDALAPLFVEHLSVASYESVAHFDEAGQDALVDQVRRLFSMQELDPALFDGRVAFSGLPLAPESAGEPSKLGRFERVLRAALPAEATLSLRRVLISSFSGEGAQLSITFGAPPSPERLQDILGSLRGIRFVPTQVPDLLATAQRGDTLLGGFELQGRHLSLWMVADRLESAGAALTLVLEQWRAAREPHLSANETSS